MKRDKYGQFEFDNLNEIEKYYPEKIIDWGLYWMCQKIKIKTDLQNNDINSIIVFRFSRGSHRIICGNQTFEQKTLENYSEEIRDELKKVDITSNCFGYVFFNTNFWVEPSINWTEFKIPIIQNILVSENYKQIDSPRTNSISII